MLDRRSLNRGVPGSAKQLRLESIWTTENGVRFVINPRQYLRSSPKIMDMIKKMKGESSSP